LHGYLEYSSRLQKWAWLVTGFSLILFAALILYGTATLKRLNDQVNVARSDLGSLQRERTDASEQLKHLYVELGNASKRGKVCNLAVTDLAGSPDRTQSAYKEAASKVPEAALITIQVAGKNQLAQASLIASYLRNAGYIVPSDEAIEVRGTHISQGTYLRYFFKDDKALAEQVVSEIKATGTDAKLYDLSGAKDLGEIHPHQFELRLGLSDLASKNAGM